MAGFCYVSSVFYQVSLCYLDQGADLEYHVRGLDKYMSDDVGKLSLKFFDHATRFIFSSSSRLKHYGVYIAPCGACTNFFCKWFSAKLGTGPAPEDYYFEP